jgi:Phage integrase, N-terminal SAM-like domain
VAAGVDFPVGVFRASSCGCCQGRMASDEKVQIVPGVEGPRWFADDTLRTSFADDGVGVRIRIDYDDNLRRYVCTSFEVFRTPDAGESKGFVTSEVLRSIAVGHLVVLALTAASGTVLRVQPNPDGVEPWGLNPPNGLREEGPTDRVLQWVAHLYRWAMAIAPNPALEVERALGLSHSTAGRWVGWRARRAISVRPRDRERRPANGEHCETARRAVACPLQGRRRPRARHFGRKTEAQRWLDEQTTAIVTGQYVDPRSGRVTFRRYAEQWRGSQVHRPSTQLYIERQLRRHAYPVLGDRPLSSIKPSDIQAWVKRLTSDLAPSTVGVVHGIVSGIFRAAMRDRVIAHNPCDGTKLPKTTKPRG